MDSFYGNYRGVVLNNEGRLGKCKIYVPSIFPEKIGTVEVSDKASYANLLPWAEPATPIFGGNTDGQGICSWPEVGATVWVFFEGGDIKYPVYFAGIPGGQAWVAQNVNQYVIQTEKTKLTIDDSTGIVTLIVSNGVNITTPTTTITGKLIVTGDIEGQANVKDSVRTMAADRVIYNSHTGHFSPANTAPAQRQ